MEEDNTNHEPLARLLTGFDSCASDAQIEVIFAQERARNLCGYLKRASQRVLAEFPKTAPPEVC